MDKNRFAQKEEEILKFWKQNKVFEKSVEGRPESEPYVFYDGPPFATGLPHYGHILSSVIKDLIPRYWTMKGKQVRRRWGWDCHGLPIETLVEKELGISGKKQIEKIGVDKFNQKARSMVLTYADGWKQMVERIGRWVEFDNSYKTMDTSYMESVWWALKTIWDKGLIYEGRKVLMYCPRCETPVSNAEISMDNSYKDITEETVVVKFKVRHPEGYDLPKNTYILAWTTTPWTLPANIALAVGQKIDYSIVAQGEENYVLAKDLVAKNIDGDYKVLKTIKGGDLDGLEYEPLFDVEAVKQDKNLHYLVTLADFVTTEDGTGVVHTAVAYGEDDYNLGQQLGLSVIPLLTSSGKYNQEAPDFLVGKDHRESQDEIKEDLRSRNLLFKTVEYSHSYPFCWRCEAPLIYNAISAWFIDIQSIKSRLIELNENISWYPEYLKQGRFKNILETAPDWNISRNRYWATPLPFWKCEKCNHTQCVGSVSELKQKSSNFDEVYDNLSSDLESIDLHLPQIDKVELSCTKCGGKMKRIPEVVDCWVESASMPFAQFHYPFENKEVFEKRFPGQFIGEYISQTRAWFYYMHALSTLLFDSNSFENVSTTGVILNEKGEKMSKSKRNFPDPQEMIDRYGVDSLRFYLMSSVVMQADNLFFSERDLREIYNKVINLSYNIANFYAPYADRAKEAKGSKVESTLDRWILSKLNNAVEQTTKHLDFYNTVKASRVILELIDDISTWWLRRSRERFRSDDVKDRQSALATLQIVVENLSLLLAPLTPFVAENLYGLSKDENDKISVHLCDWPKYDRELIDINLEEDMQKVRKIVEIGHSVRAQEGLRVRQPLAGIFTDVKFSNDGIKYHQIILDELNIEKFVTERSQVKDGVEVKERDCVIVLDKHLDERLLKLGDLRDLTRAIQSRRKASGLKAGEPARMVFSADAEVVKLINENKSDLMDQTTLSAIDDVAQDDKQEELQLSCGKVYLFIE